MKHCRSGGQDRYVNEKGEKQVTSKVVTEVLDDVTRQRFESMRGTGLKPLGLSVNRPGYLYHSSAN